MPSIDTRAVETQVLVADGQTVVLGGIYETERRETINKVPFLGDIPVVGVLFQSKQRIDNKAELLIFVTPRILEEGSSIYLSLQQAIIMMKANLSGWLSHIRKPCTMRKPQNVFLIGPMGAGKSAVGRQLARLLHLNFMDSDDEIESRTGVDIPFIFEKEGEDGFRKREAKVIDDLSRSKGLYWPPVAAPS